MVYISSRSSPIIVFLSPIKQAFDMHLPDSESKVTLSKTDTWSPAIVY